jgi:hypothetical protein
MRIMVLFQRGFSKSIFRGIWAVSGEKLLPGINGAVHRPSR